jgi:calcineurin-like phosphoesterase family protein
VDAGFADVLGEQVELTLGDGHDRRPALACHFPYFGDSHDEERFESHRPVDDGRLLLHGHVHTRWRIEDHQVNVGCDVWDYRPVSEEAILRAVRADERHGPTAP